ncbi:MAG: hypothetical protein LBK95_04670 [Bifidobacteriaceae bacterium]|jgi:hypothetical protein|nr:hypothetical protein [Bifidobacteriaceae bacterium]
METISLTDFNQNPSRAARLADRDGAVQISRRGRVAYRLNAERAEPPADPIDALIAAGLAQPARTAQRRPIPRSTPPTGTHLGDSLEADRARLDPHND